MPFDPKDALEFYNAMMQSLSKEWLLLFADTKHVISCDNVPDMLNFKIIIDDNLFYYNHVPSLLHYFLVLSKCLRNIACHLY